MITAEVVSSEPQPSTKERFLNSRLAVVAVLDGVALFLGLPALWMSPVFSRSEKVVHTIGVCIWALVVFAGFYAVMAWSLARIREAL